MNPFATGSVELVGTAHVSENSRERVIDAIETARPDVVAIELDAERFRRMWGEDSFSIREALQSGQSLRATVLEVCLAANQRRALDGTDLSVGGSDMLPAARTAYETDASVRLIDADSTETVERLARRTLSLKTVMSLLHFALDRDAHQQLEATAEEFEAWQEAAGYDEATMAERIERLETMPESELETLLEFIGELLPAQKRIMLDERNEYMAGRLHWLRERGHDVVAVVGRAHVPGMRRLLESPGSIPAAHVVEPRAVRFVERGDKR